MENTTNPTNDDSGLRKPKTAANDLRGRQSVRTTFKLSEATIHAVRIVAAHLGIKQKSLFDHLTDDLTAWGGVPAETQGTEHPAHARVQKTYVISRRSLDSLERLAKDLLISRDLVVEISVQRLLPLIEAERQQHARRKEVLIDMKQQTARGREFLRKTRLLLGDDDPVTAIIATATKAMETASQQVEGFVERGRIIEEALRDE